MANVRVTKKKSAPKKKTRRGATSKSKELASMQDFEKQMAIAAEADSARVGSGADSAFISIKGGSFTFQEADLGKSIEVIILGFVNEKSYYDFDYDPDNISAPACFAIGNKKPDDLVPFKGVAKQQSEVGCDTCWANEYGTAERGRGKACRDFRKLMCISTDELGNEVANIEVATMRVPPTSIKAFDKYIKGIGKVSKRTCYGVITTITVDMDDDYPVLHFAAEDLISDVSTMQLVMELKEINDDYLLETHDPDAYQEPAPKPKRGRTKAAPKKKATTKKRGRSKVSRR